MPFREACLVWPWTDLIWAGALCCLACAWDHDLPDRGSCCAFSAADALWQAAPVLWDAELMRERQRPGLLVSIIGNFSSSSWTLNCPKIHRNQVMHACGGHCGERLWKQEGSQALLEHLTGAGIQHFSLIIHIEGLCVSQPLTVKQGDHISRMDLWPCFQIKCLTFQFLIVTDTLLSDKHFKVPNKTKQNKN